MSNQKKKFSKKKSKKLVSYSSFGMTMIWPSRTFLHDTAQYLNVSSISPAFHANLEEKMSPTYSILNTRAGLLKAEGKSILQSHIILY